MRAGAVLVGFVVPAATQPRAQEGTAGPVTFTKVTVVDVRTGQTSPSMAVTVDGGRIAAITPGNSATNRGREIDASGKFLIPGLWDMHVHLIFGDWFPDGREVTLPLFVV